MSFFIGTNMGSLLGGKLAGQLIKNDKYLLKYL